jgi:hypothetical protein
MVKSRFSFRYFYSNYLIVAGVLTTATYGLTHRSEMTVVKHGVEENGLIICYVLLGMGLCSLFFLLKNSVVLKVWPDRLVLQHLFSSTTIRKEDILFIDLAARKRSPLRYRRLVDAIVVHRGTKQIRIWVNAYRNGPEIKRAIQLYLFPAQPADSGERSAPAGALSQGPPVTYARSWLTSGSGLMFCGIVLLLSWLFFIAAKVPLVVRAGLIMAFVTPFFLLLGNFQYYFLVDGQELTVRNHFFLWYKRQFSLAGIRSAIIEDGVQRTIALRITMRDFECHAFIAESLRQPEWQALAKRLGENGILVVDEAY